MTILFLDQFSEPGGAQQCLADLLPAVAARGWKAVVAAPGPGWLASRAQAAGADFHPVDCGPFRSGRKSFSDLLRFGLQAPGLSRTIKDIGADLVYVNGPRLLPAVPAGRPVIFHCHSLLAGRSARWLVRRALCRTRATVIAACRFVLQPLDGAAMRTHVVYNGVAAQQPRLPHAGFRIGIVGRIAPQKGQLELLRAARHLPGCRIVVCGAPLFGDRGYWNEVRAAARNLPVEFMDWQPQAAPILAALDLLVVPSTVPEATPRVILEAFAAGVPVLASACGGISELIEDGRTGFLIRSLEPIALARQIAGLAAQPELLAAVAASAQDAWRRRYTLAEYQRNILDIIAATRY